MSDDERPAMLWAERVRLAYASWQRWHLIPGRFRMDRVLKDAGVRDLVVENERLRKALADIAVVDDYSMAVSLACAALDRDRP